MSNQEDKQPLYSDIKKNEEEFKKRLGMDKSFDVGIRKLEVFDKEIQLYFVQGLSEDQPVMELLKEIMKLESRGRKVPNVRKAVENHLVNLQVEYKDTFEDCITEMLSGLIFILMEGESEAFIVDVRFYPGRGPEEPDTEKVVRGARDGYTENIIENTALTRRRIRDERLRHEIIKVGKRSKTDICISYIEDVADHDLVEIIKKELETVNIDGFPMGDKSIEEYLVKQGYNPFPLVRYTERPDVAATHLFEGHVIILVDASPSVIITPTTFFHHVQHAEEHRQAPSIGTFLRWIRFFGMVAGLFIAPLWLLFVLSPDMLPPWLDYIGPQDEHNIPIFTQIFLAEIGIELLRMAAIHTPDPLATALGLVAALLIGEIAMEVGLFSAEVILYVAVGAVGSFATPSYELSLALKMMRLLFILAIGFWGALGFVVSAMCIFLFMCGIRSLNKPYMWPLLPFDPLALWQIFVRQTVPAMKVRLRIVNPKDEIRQTKG
ncbi:spore germination protein [Salsuginibacillus kocurii]|uniref:spore germination protein n=1 Tax=Salsuginibacillus kocurii TaxID=427078 RepID=UPI0003653BC6|nr:spore germination protein [Salsuginibacillus kocurii]